MMAESKLSVVTDWRAQTVTFLVNGVAVVKIWPWAERVEVAPEWRADKGIEEG